jgi:hypothetical protein
MLPAKEWGAKTSLRKETDTRINHRLWKHQIWNAKFTLPFSCILSKNVIEWNISGKERGIL